MLRSRIIPCLLIQDGGLVKTKSFKEPTYIGDPLNAVRILNEKMVDELTVFNIDSNRHKTGPNMKLIEQLAAECRMPLCYGGGISSFHQIEDIISLGVEKVSLSRTAVTQPEIISETAALIGSQSVAVVMDCKFNRLRRKHEIYIDNGKTNTGLNATDFASTVESLGAGEIIINSIDQDGQMNGYDIKLIKKIRQQSTIPLTALGGAGKLDDLISLIDEIGLIGAAAGSLFVFKGKYRAVLINYPSPEERSVLGI